MEFWQNYDSIRSLYLYCYTRQCHINQLRRNILDDINHTGENSMCNDSDEQLTSIENEVPEVDTVARPQRTTRKPDRLITQI